MKTVSLKIDDSIIVETDEILDGLKKSRNRYINEAIDYYNKIQKRAMLAKILKRESEMTRDESMKVLKEFEAFEYED
ncbi:hypothetical protein MNBD_BACTEROID06-574 [hydrothermal vent metagenome]|uniref:Ribbon-helix-helix protein CopG domain-containing protein n=1 Tax=hydrothermal vent metagenome TaxID=652676 RepID=A0A3B0V7B9_9ZZZZ